jgi:hypothetical protein
MRINLQVLSGRFDDFLFWLIPCLFGDTGIKPAELDLWSEKNPVPPLLPLIPETRNLQHPTYYTHPTLGNVLFCCAFPGKKGLILINRGTLDFYKECTETETETKSRHEPQQGQVPCRAEQPSTWHASQVGSFWPNSTSSWWEFF